MARLGEELAQAGIVSTEKVEQALRAQVVWGGRLGTNLIELGCVDLDGLTRALGQQHGVPAALARHFDKADPELQAQLPFEIARRFSVVPLVRLSPERIAVVALDPLDASALDALASIYGVDATTGIVMSVAAEMRVLYHLERVYKIARPTRFLRTKGAGVTPFPQFDNVPVEADSDTDIPITIDEHEALTVPVEKAVAQAGNADDMAAMIDLAIDAFTTTQPTDHAANEPQGRDRRTYLRTLADETGSDGAADPIEVGGFQPIEAPPAAHADLTKSGALARIAIRRVAVSGTTVLPAGVPATGELRTVPANLSEAIRAIKRGPHRDRVAELVVETLQRFVPACEAALLLVVRGDVAIGWKEFCRAGEATTDIAVPLDQAGMIPTVIAENRIARSAVAALGGIDGRLLRALGREDGELAILPIAIGEQVMCVVAVAVDGGTRLDPIESVAGAASAAFSRLIRAASR